MSDLAKRIRTKLTRLLYKRGMDLRRRDLKQ